MAYRVELAKTAEAELEELYLWVVERAPSQGAAWFNGLERAILSPKQLPKRCRPTRSVSTFSRTLSEAMTKVPRLQREDFGGTLSDAEYQLRLAALEQPARGKIPARAMLKPGATPLEIPR